MKLGAGQVLHLGLWLAACAPGEQGNSGGSGGDSAVGSGGTLSASGGSQAAGGAGGGVGTGGAASGGLTGSGGAAAGGTASGGSAAGGSSGGDASTGGAATGGTASGGAENLLTIAEALDGARVDDPCAGTPAVSVGATCDHVVLTGAGFHDEEEVTIGGDPETTYDVTLRIRGVTEPANVVGGERPSTETFSYMGLDWRTEPLTIGGTVPTDDADYAQWRITVAAPSAEYFLNDYQRVGHYVFELDYEVTFPMQGGTTVTLDATDSNERLILNYEAYAPEGIPGSINHGQFVELELVSVTEQ